MPISWRIVHSFLWPTQSKVLALNKAKVDVFLELPCFFDDPTDVGYLIDNIMLVSAKHQYESATAKHMSPPSWSPLPCPTLPHPSRLCQNTGLSSLCHIANSHLPSIFHKIKYIFPCYPFNSSHHLLPPLCLQVCSLFLCFNCYPANRLINIIFLDSTHMH